MNRLFQSILICVLIILIGEWAISFINPYSGSGMDTQFLKNLAMLIVWLVGIVVGATHFFDGKGR